MLINVLVHSNSSQEKVEKTSDKSYEVWIKEKPVDGKANLKLIKIIKKYFRAKKVEIKSGFTSRKKLVEVEM